MESRSAFSARKWAIGGAATFAFALLFAAPAFGCGPSAYINSNPASAGAGDTFTVFGNGFIGDSALQVHWESITGPVLASATTNANGQFKANVTVPADAAPGQHLVTTTQAGVEGGRTDIKYTFTVADPAAAEVPVAEKPVAEEPVAEKPVAEEPVAEKPVAEEPVAEEPVAEKPVAEKPVAEEPLAEKPVAKEPVAEKPVTKEPVAEKPVPHTHVSEQPVVKQPVAHTHVAADPVINEPVIKEPVINEPVINEPAAISLVPERPLLGRDAIIDRQAIPQSVPDQPALGEGSTINEPGINAPAAEDRGPLVGAGVNADASADAPLNGGTAPWALIPLLLLGGGLLAASGAALTSEMRQRSKSKAEIEV